MEFSHGNLCVEVELQMHSPVSVNLQLIEAHSIS